jgi:hypothetical protein
MVLTAVRWAVVDHLHAMTGIRPPKLDFSRLGNRVAAFQLLIEIHYRHYQFYANMFIATAVAYICHRLQLASFWHFDLRDVLFIDLEVILCRVADKRNSPSHCVGAASVWLDRSY